ncbi:cryptochrome/photolyase family protein [Sulfodiicoccus acidiphilus]|uniref:cryptochrome/photolyase family protein n=1 Tax=Sulfodiicoccus acidiphilus TaxID=1670455 RepID=UPI0016687B00|nr:deoxyribodipyrimidine photo-lyase [Sulfodiicoccus acidiphilus]
MFCAFLFRRDLRLQDNTGLNLALESCQAVVPLLVLDPRQLLHNEYKSDFAIAFFINSIVELNEELKTLGGELNLIEGIAEDVIPSLPVNAIFFNQDYTPFAKIRDEKLMERCKSRGIQVNVTEDYTLMPKEFFLRKGRPYHTFSRFYAEAMGISIRKPVGTKGGKFSKSKLGTSTRILSKYVVGEKPIVRGGRREAMGLLERARTLNVDKREFPAEEATTMLSAHIKFGTVSIREAYYNVPEPIRRQLFWRDFFTLIAYYNPRVFGEAFKQEYNCIKWENDWKKFKAWTEGRTGFPLVDAGMRQLNAVGYMHNRVRMVAASVLVKLLHIDWRIGEKYFATKLVDYDPAVNNGNWQWVASTGTDYMFRLYNPWLQQRKFDPDAEYIKKWVTELRGVSKEKILDLERKEVNGYRRPIVEYRGAAEEARRMYFRSLTDCGGNSKSVS